MPVLALTTIQYALHSVNHLIDIGKAHPAWNGYFDFFSLAAATVLLAWLWRVAAREASAMRVFVAGATGVIGRALLPQLIAAGHEPIAMTRSAEKADALRERGIEACVCDAYDAERLAHTVADASPEQIVHLLTDLPEEINMRRFEQETASTGRLRREGTRNLVAAARAAGVQRIVGESIAFAYASEGDRVKDEDAPLAAATLPSVVEPLAELERQLLDAGGIVLRYGQLYGPGSSFTKDGSWARNLRRRRLPLVGAGAGIFSFVHVEDAASATVAALAHSGPATYNVVDDEPADDQRMATRLHPRRRRARSVARPGVARAARRRSGRGGDDERAARRQQRAHQARARLAAEVRELAPGLRAGARLSYFRTTSTTPTTSSASPAMREASMCCLAIPNSPKRSIATEIASWPAMTTAVRPLAPSVRTATSATVT